MDYYALLFFRYLKSKGSKGLRMIYDAFKGGTEQLLPVNTDTPTTSPIIADIQYTDALRENQEFTYRECPITVDGRAKIKSIKGNTLVWNQFFPTPTTFPESSTFAFANGDRFVQGHKFLVDLKGTVVDPDVGNPILYLYRNISGSQSYQVVQNGFGASVFECSATSVSDGTTSSSATDNTWIFCNRRTNANLSSLNFIDLTAMFGSTKADEIYAMEQSVSGSGVAYFRSLYPLPYYQYDAGSLLPFNGSGVKTVCFNQWDEDWELGAISTTNGNNYADSNRIRSTNYISVVPNTSYYFLAPTNITVTTYDGSNEYLGSMVVPSTGIRAFDSNVAYIRFFLGSSQNPITTYGNDICINFSSSENGKYKSYQSSTLDIPTSTYFPSGMRSAGTVYDELTNSKAITRVGTVDLGTLTWHKYTSSGGIDAYYVVVPNINTSVVSGQEPIITVLGYTALNSVGRAQYMTSANDHEVMQVYNTGSVYFKNSAYSTEEEIATAMSGVILYFGLAEESSVDVDQSDTNELLNNALSTIMGRSVSSNNPQQVLDVLTKGE